MLCTPKTRWREGAGHNTSRPWAGGAAAPQSRQHVPQQKGALTSASGETWTPAFPPSASEGAKTSSQELGEVAKSAWSSEGSCATLNPGLLAICLAAEAFPDFLAGAGGDQCVGPLKQDFLKVF